MPLSPNEILSATRTVNEEVLDQALRHAHHLQRLSTHEVNEIVGFLNRDVLPDTLDNLRRRLENISQRGFETGPWTTSRVRNMLGSTNEIMQKGMQTAGQNLRGDLRQFARTEAEWQVRSLSKATGALDIAFQTPSVSQLNSILTSRPYQGAVFNKWWSNVSSSSQNIINQQIGIGLAEGETVDQMIRRLKGTVGARFRDGALEKVRHNVAATVRTATNHVNTQAREMTYTENDEVVKGIQYVATLDGRTTDICMSLDGKVFDVGEGPRPPQHYQCRSTTVPVLKSMEELGLPKLRKALPEGTRATKEVTGHVQKMMNGQVPAKVTYGQWLKKQTATVQNDILGPSRAKMFRSGQVAIDKFVDPRGRPMTLDQLRKREGLKVAEPPAAPVVSPRLERLKVPGEVLGGGRSSASVEWEVSFSQEERDAIDAWTTENYRNIRKAQIGTPVSDPHRWKDTTRGLQAAYDKSPRAIGVVYRGLHDVDTEAFKKLATAKRIEFKAFASSTTERDYGIRFVAGFKNNILFKIEQKTGCDLHWVSMEAREAEVLMAKGSKFDVLQRKWVKLAEDIAGDIGAPRGAKFLEITMREVF